MTDPSGNPGGLEAVSHPILGILLLIALALVAAEMVRHKKRLPSVFRVLIYTYTEFILVGLAIGPQGFNLIDNELLAAGKPFLHLSLGGIGLIYGLQFSLTQMKRFSRWMFAMAFFQAAVTFTVCGAGVFFIACGLGVATGDAAFIAAILGTIASVSAPQIIAHTIQEQKVRGENAHLLQFITALDGGFGLFVLTLLVGARTEHALTNWPWVNALAGVGLSATVGLTCGLVFHWLTEAQRSVEEMILYLMGFVVLGSSVAASLQLSPLFVNVVFGMTVANLSVRVEEVYGQMGRLEKPLYIVLLILAGARWQISAQWLLPLVTGYLVFRILGKWAGCYAASRWFPLYFRPVDRLGVGLMGQGGIALALLINFSLIEKARAIPLLGAEQLAVVETVVIVAIILAEIMAPPLVRHVLVRGEEWRSAS